MATLLQEGAGKSRLFPQILDTSMRYEEGSLWILSMYISQFSICGVHELTNLKMSMQQKEIHFMYPRAGSCLSRGQADSHWGESYNRRVQAVRRMSVCARSDWLEVSYKS